MIIKNQRPILLIGFSTTNKSTIARQLCKQFPDWSRIDSDVEIAKGYGSSIHDIYYHFPDKASAEVEIDRLENAFLEKLTSYTSKTIIAAGPEIPLRKNFASYIAQVQPQVILLEKSSSEIYEGLMSRREAMLRKEQHQRPEFGRWDLVDLNLPKEEAIRQLEIILQERKLIYESYADLIFHSKEFFGGKVPAEIMAR